MATATAKKQPANVNANNLLLSAWVIGLGSSLVMAYFEYFAITADLDMSHTSLFGYPGYCLAMIITTILAFMYANTKKRTWTVATVLLSLWTIVSVASTVLVHNSNY